MSAKRVDYDRIAPTYDRRFKVGGMQRSTTQALSGLARRLRAERVLEVGCGTGRWLADLQPVTGRSYGLDLSRGMLARARRRDDGLGLVRGRGGWLPFAGGSFDLVYCVNAIHHFGRQREFVYAARRLLRPGGALAVVGSTPHGRRESWYVYEFFEGTYETDLARFPPWGRVLDWMVSAGFERVEWRVVTRISDHRAGRAVLEDPFLEKNASSQLALLSDAAYAAGMARIREALATAEETGEERVFKAHILIGMLVGWLAP